MSICTQGVCGSERNVFTNDQVDFVDQDDDRAHITMALETIAIGIISIIYFLLRYLNATETPKIKGLPEIPGIPLFGNLLQLGDQHAKVAGKWAEKYGAVFQTRLGNKVGVV